MLGGVTEHDIRGYLNWEYILAQLGLLEYDHTIANIAHTAGMILMMLTLILGGYPLIKQFRNLNMH